MLFSTPGLHGAYRRADLLEAFGRRRLRDAIRCGRFRPLWTGTLVDGCRFLDVRTRAAAALLAIGPDAILCGPTAATLHGCTAIASADTHVLVPYDRGPRSRPGLVVHHSCFYSAQVTTIDQLRVLSLPQVIADLLCTTRAADALAVADESLRRAEPNSDELRAAVTQRLRVRPDPRGTVRAAGLWDLASPAAESPPESWLRLLIVELGFPLPEVNFTLLTPTGKELYRLDLAWPNLRIALEYDGYAVHVGREEQDAARREDLRRRGWIVIHVTADDLADPSRMAAKLRAAFATRGYTW